MRNVFNKWGKMIKSLSDRIAEIANYAGSFENQIIRGDLIYCLQWLNSSLKVITELQTENQALKIKNFENAKEQYEDFKAVSEENQALLAKNKSWQKMVESTNETNEAMGNMLNEFEAKVKELEGKVWIAKEYLGCMSENEARITGSKINSHFADAINNMAAFAKKGLRAIEQGKIEPDSEEEWQEQEATEIKKI